MRPTSPLRFVLAAALALGCGPAGGEPDAPRVDAPPERTATNPLEITGSGEPNAEINFSQDGETVARGDADDRGDFRIEVPLRADAANTLLVTQTVDGQESAPATVSVEHDGTAPMAPMVDPAVSPTRRMSQRIRGAAEALSTITITGGLAEASAQVDGSGRFDVAVMLSSSATMTVSNALSVTATDAVGNVSAPTEFTILFDPTLPVEAPLLDDVPAFTNQATLTLTGEAEVGAMISAVGGATDGSTSVDTEGRFTVDIGLRPNQLNALRVFAIVEGDASGPVTRNVVHDDIAPAAAQIEPQASPTGAQTITLRGEAEPGATVNVTGAAGDASGLVDEERNFSVDLSLTLDSDNVLVATVVDRAGNESEPVEMTITQNSTLPVPVEVSRLPSPTNTLTHTLTGSTEPDADIEITGGADTVMTTANGTGDFSVLITLNANARNELRVTRPGSGVDTILVVLHDDIAPESPQLNAVTSPTNRRMVDVSGMTEPRARVSVTGAVAPVAVNAGDDGRFSATVEIAADSETTLSVTATDRAANTSAPVMLTVTHSSSAPDAPNVDDVAPPPTNQATHVVTGSVNAPSASVTIEITGGAATATGPTDPDTGAFSVEVTLSPNTTQELSVISLDGVIPSSPRLVTITHDDVAPATPTTEAVSASAGTGLGVCVGGSVSGGSGAVENNARVYVWNQSRGQSQPGAPSTTATETGSFTTGLNSCGGEIIRVRVEDAAGNFSDFVEVVAN